MIFNGKTDKSNTLANIISTRAHSIPSHNRVYRNNALECGMSGWAFFWYTQVESIYAPNTLFVVVVSNVLKCERSILVFDVCRFLIDKKNPFLKFIDAHFAKNDFSFTRSLLSFESCDDYDYSSTAKSICTRNTKKIGRN